MNPQGVALTYKGDILVTDSNNQCVQVRGGSAGTQRLTRFTFLDVFQQRELHIQVGQQGKVSRTVAETYWDCCN